MLSVHMAFSSSSFMFAGTIRKVSMMFRTLVHSWRVLWIRVRTMRLNVSTLMAKARVATGSISPFCDVILAAVWYACCSATSPNRHPRLSTSAGTGLSAWFRQLSRNSEPSTMMYRFGMKSSGSKATSPAAHLTSRNSPMISSLDD